MENCGITIKKEADGPTF
jgi:hypothetical protein